MATRKRTRTTPPKPKATPTRWDVSFTAPGVSGATTVTATTAAKAEGIVRVMFPDAHTVNARAI